MGGCATEESEELVTDNPSRRRFFKCLSLRGFCGTDLAELVCDDSDELEGEVDALMSVEDEVTESGLGTGGEGDAGTVNGIPSRRRCLRRLSLRRF